MFSEKNVILIDLAFAFMSKTKIKRSKWARSLLDRTKHFHANIMNEMRLIMQIFPVVS